MLVNTSKEDSRKTRALVSSPPRGGGGSPLSKIPALYRRGAGDVSTGAYRRERENQRERESARDGRERESERARDLRGGTTGNHRDAARACTAGRESGRERGERKRGRAGRENERLSDHPDRRERKGRREGKEGRDPGPVRSASTTPSFPSFSSPSEGALQRRRSQRGKPARRSASDAVRRSASRERLPIACILLRRPYCAAPIAPPLRRGRSPPDFGPNPCFPRRNHVRPAGGARPALGRRGDDSFGARRSRPFALAAGAARRCKQRTERATGDCGLTVTVTVSLGDGHGESP